MGIGNITELTDADTTGMNALLIGFCQELGIRHVLTTEVIPWARGSVREVDVARRLMYAARQRGVLPKHVDDRLLTVKDARPKYYTEAELRELHRAITDPNFRIATTREAICVFNNQLFVSGTDIQALFEQLGVEDPAHAFYLGKELMKARLALLLGKTLRAGAAAPLGLSDAPARGHASPPGSDRGAPEAAQGLSGGVGARAADLARRRAWRGEPVASIPRGPGHPRPPSCPDAGPMVGSTSGLRGHCPRPGRTARRRRVPR